MSAENETIRELILCYGNIVIDSGPRESKKKKQKKTSQLQSLGREPFSEKLERGNGMAWQWSQLVAESRGRKNIDSKHQRHGWEYDYPG